MPRIWRAVRDRCGRSETTPLSPVSPAGACSGHATRQSLEIYSRLALADAQQRYDDVIGNFPV